MYAGGIGQLIYRQCDNSDKTDSRMLRAALLILYARPPTAKALPLLASSFSMYCSLSPILPNVELILAICMIKDNALMLSAQFCCFNPSSCRLPIIYISNL